MRPRPTVTLTTDFGWRDPYVAAMKGVLLRGCPDVRIIDLSHEIAARDVMEGALFLAAALPCFPAGTVHLAVIDPGVGTARRPIAAAAAGQTVVCPDNGLLTLFARAHPLDEAREIVAPRPPHATLVEVSATFHGRDVFAPAAARLACGEALSALGPALDAPEIVALDVPRPRRDGVAIRGEVIHVDRFGNAISNIDRATLGETAVTEVRAGGRALGGLRRTYGDANEGEPLALFGSGGWLEIAVNGGSASAQLGLGRGDVIEVVTAG